MASRPVTGTPLREASVVERWRVHKLKCRYRDLNGTAILCGYAPHSDDGVVSDPIKYFDREAMLVTTTSGQRFYLTGPSGGESKDRDHVWLRYLSRYRIEDATEISARYTHKKKRPLKMAG